MSILPAERKRREDGGWKVEAWTTDNGQRTMDNGPRTTDHRPRTTDQQVPTPLCHLRSAIFHLQYPISHLRSSFWPAPGLWRRKIFHDSSRRMRGIAHCVALRDHRPQTTDNRRQITDYGPRTTDYGRQTVKLPKSVVLWSVVLWSHGTWSCWVTDRSELPSSSFGLPWVWRTACICRVSNNTRNCRFTLDWPARLCTPARRSNGDWW